MKEFWEERYSEKEFAYGARPNVFFKKQIDQLKPGKILLPLEGEGRNAIYAASKKWEVEAFDFSKKAKENCLKEAAQKKLRINYTVSDALSYNSSSKFDAIALLFTHLPSATRNKFHRLLIEFLKPGGILIAQGFHPYQLSKGYKSGGPKNSDWLYEVSQLKSDFKQLRQVLGEETETLLDEGKYHQGKAYVSNFIAQKKI